jgi:hypothetical protein
MHKYLIHHINLRIDYVIIFTFDCSIASTFTLPAWGSAPCPAECTLLPDQKTHCLEAASPYNKVKNVPDI